MEVADSARGLRSIGDMRIPATRCSRAGGAASLHAPAIRQSCTGSAGDPLRLRRTPRLKDSRSADGPAKPLNGGCDTAVAVKSQHAYHRPLRWAPRTRSRSPEQPNDDPTRRHGRPRGAHSSRRLVPRTHSAHRHRVRSADKTPHWLPGGHGAMRPERLSAAALGDLFRAFPDTRFVLLHGAYPHFDEVLALVKHFPNVYVDLAWAWSIDPPAAARTRYGGPFMRFRVTSCSCSGRLVPADDQCRLRGPVPTLVTARAGGGGARRAPVRSLTPSRTPLHAHEPSRAI